MVTPDHKGGKSKIGCEMITFYINGKKRIQKVHVNKRGTKCVMIKGNLIPISRVKKVS